MHNNKLPLTGLLTLLQWTIHNTACIVLHPAIYFDICGVKWHQYVAPVVVCEHLCWLVIEKMPIIDTFAMHYSKICWKLQERYICRFVCLYWVYFDRCCPLFNKQVGLQIGLGSCSMHKWMNGNVWRIKNVKRVSVKPKKHREIFEIFHEIFQGKKIHKLLYH